MPYGGVAGEAGTSVEMRAQVEVRSRNPQLCGGV
jgi:hypothetical protein